MKEGEYKVGKGRGLRMKTIEIGSRRKEKKKVPSLTRTSPICNEPTDEAVPDIETKERSPSKDISRPIGGWSVNELVD